MKKVIPASILALSMAVSLLGGCSGGSSSASSAASSSGSVSTAPASSSAAAESDSGEKTEIVFLHWTQEPEMAPAVEAFNESQDKIKVTYVMVPSGGDSTVKMNTMLMSGETYDVFGQWSTEHLYQRVQNGLARGLNDLLEKNGMDYDKYFGEAARQTETFGGEVYGIPYACNRFEIMYNKQIFDNAGVAYPQDGWTWNDYAETAKAISSGEGSNKIYGSGENPLYNCGWTLLAQLKLGLNALYKSEAEVNVDDPAFTSSLQFFYDLQEAGALMPQSEMTTRQIGDLGTRYQNFLKGGFGMMMAPSYMVFQLNYPDNARGFDIGYVNMPVLEGTESTTILEHSALSISANTKHPDEAFQWIKFYCVDRPDLGGAAKGMMPPAALTGFYEDPAMEEICNNRIFTAPGVDFNEALSVFTKPEEKIVPGLFFNTYNIALNEFQTVMTEEATKVMIGEQDVATAISNMKTRGDDLLAKA